MQRGESGLGEPGSAAPNEAPKAAARDLFPPDLGRKVVPVVAAAVLLYVAFFVFTDAKATLHELVRADGVAIAAAILVSLASFLIRSLRWHWLVRQSAIAVPFADNLIVNCAGLAMTITPGKAGELLKSLMLKERFGVPVSQSAPLLVLERISDLLAVVLLAGLGLTQIANAGLLVFLTLAAGLAGCVFAVALPHLLRRVPEAWLRLRFIASRKEKAMRSLGALQAGLAPRPFLLTLGLSLAAWALQSLTVWIFARAYGIDQVSVLQGIVAYCAPLLAGAVALVPGGLGATEVSMAGLLIFLTDPPMDLSTSAALTILVRLATFWLAILVGLTFMAIWRLRMRRFREP